MNHPVLNSLAAVLLVGLSACSSVSHQNGGESQAELSPAALAQALAEADRASASGLATPADRASYRQATERAVAIWMALSDPNSRRQGMNVPSAKGAFMVQPSWPDNLYFDTLIPASTIKTKALKHRVVREGIGAPFVAVWKYTEERKAVEPFITRMGYVVPVTATLEFRDLGKGARQAALKLHDPRMDEKMAFSGKQQELGADFTAVGEYILSQKKAQMSGLGAMMLSANHLDKLGIIALEHPAKDRIPVFFVHGLMSRRAAWQNVFNELGADPAIQRKYQFFFFRYPSGVPVVFSAAKFREQLKVLREEMDRQGNYQLSHHMVLVGHSMGGLVSKSQIQRSGDRLWVNILGDKPEKLGIPPGDVAALRTYLEFNPNPYIDRVIFVATPHRGSTMAQGTVGAIGRTLISLPGRVLGNTFDMLQGHAPSSPLIRDLIKAGIPSSIENLSPESKYVKNSTSMPLAPGVHVHSIIGNKDNRLLTDPKCSDGVVPYASSHLDGVESELVVHSNHGAHETAEGIAEIRRILVLHEKSL